MTALRFDFNRFDIIDLSHTLHSEIPHWGMNIGDKGIELETEVDYTVGGMCSQKIKAYLRAGTHYDAPAHFYPNAQTIDQMEPATLMGPCVMIDVSTNFTDKYKVTVDDVLEILGSNLNLVQLLWFR
jgi:kynurenine formamidase